MEQFQLLEGDRTLKASREQLNNALSTVRSLSSGTAFPTTNLSDGMLCYRTDHGRLYQLTDAANNIWTDRIAMSIAGTAATADTVAWSSIENKPTAYPAEEHTHTYAGSLTEGGSATKAEALATPRTINGTPFDGTADITIAVPWENIENKPASYACADKLTTPRTINGVSFDGTANITIAVPPTPKAYVTATWKSGAKWYRVWSDGRIEQGGNLSALKQASSASLVTCTFPKAFTSTNYQFMMNVSGTMEGHSSVEMGWHATSKTKTAINVSMFSADNASGTVDWYACGY